MTQQLKILYLEDDIEDIQQVKWLLEDAVVNFDLCFATTGSDFVKALSEFSPDIILADDSLPDFDSEQALKISTENKINAPFILLTGNTSEDFAAAMLKKGAFDYVHKTNILRLPNAIMKAIKLKNFEKERDSFLKDVIANEALLKEAESLAHLGSWEVDLVTYVTKWSDEAFRLYGYEPGEAKPSFELFLNHIHPDDLAFVNKMTSDAMIASSKKLKFDFRIVDNHGVIKYIRSELSISKNNDGNPIRLSGFNLDITESVIAEQEKINRESFYKKIIEHSSDMKILMSEEGTIFYGSPAVTKILGFSPGNYKGANGIKWIHPRELPAFINILKKLMLEPSGRLNSQQRIRRIDGSYLWCDVTISNHLKEPDISALVANFRDITDQIIYESKIIESEKQYRNLFENNPMPMWISDSETHRFLDVNQSALNHYGYCRDEFLSMSALDIRPEEEITKFLEEHVNIRNLTNLGIRRHKKKDGALFDVEIFANNILYQGKSARLILSNDITPKKEAEERLLQSQAHLLASQHIGNIGSWELGLNNKRLLNNGKIYWSDQTYRIFGYAPDEIDIYADFFMKCVHPEDREKVRKITKHAIRNFGFYSVQYRIIRRDGQERNIQNRAEVICDPTDQKAIKIIGAIQDITEMKIAENALAKSEANLSTIVNNSNILYVLLDTDLNIRYFNTLANKAFLQELGREIEPGSFCLDYYTGVRKLLMAKNCRKVLAGKKVKYETKFTPENGETIWYENKFTPVKGIEGQILGIILSKTDITERKTTELERERITSDLIRQNKELEQFAYIVSHNLRGPVANILGTAELLKENHLSTDEYNMLMNGLDHTVHKLDDVIHDLNYILQAKNPVNEKREFVEFSSLIDDIKISIRDKIESEQVQIFSDFSTVPGFMGVKSYLYSIFYNLISNSIKYRQHDICPYISITSKITDDSLLLSFKDNGIGMDMKSVNDQLFHLYKRFHFHTEGKGMGLYMVKTQVETLGGSISVLSEENKGTEFLITFKS